MRTTPTTRVGLAVVLLGALHGRGRAQELALCPNQEATSCRICNATSNLVVFDLTSINSEVMTVTYGIHAPNGQNKTFVHSPCGFPATMPSIPGLSGYNTSGIFAGLATDPNSFVFCHPEVDPSRCYVYGRRDTTDYSVVPGLASGSTQYSVMRAIVHSDTCMPGCGGSCEGTVIHDCNLNRSDRTMMEEAKDRYQQLCAQTPDPCHPCVVVLSQTMCNYRPCPNDCSNHGVCNEQEMCVCDEGFAGADCGSDEACMDAGNCSPFASCQFNSNRAPVCRCLQGYSGDGVQCQPDVNIDGGGGNYMPRKKKTATEELALPVTGLVVGVVLVGSLVALGIAWRMGLLRKFCAKKGDESVVNLTGNSREVVPADSKSARADAAGVELRDVQPAKAMNEAV